MNRLSKSFKVEQGKKYGRQGDKSQSKINMYRGVLTTYPCNCPPCKNKNERLFSSVMSAVHALILHNTLQYMLLFGALCCSTSSYLAHYTTVHDNTFPYFHTKGFSLSESLMLVAALEPMCASQCVST